MSYAINIYLFRVTVLYVHRQMDERDAGKNKRLSISTRLHETTPKRARMHLQHAPLYFKLQIFSRENFSDISKYYPVLIKNLFQT